MKEIRPSGGLLGDALRPGVGSQHLWRRENLQIPDRKYAAMYAVTSHKSTTSVV